MKEAKELKLLSELIGILSNYCGERGDSEGAVETLTRIIHERDSCNCIRLKRHCFSSDAIVLYVYL